MSCAAASPPARSLAAFSQIVRNKHATGWPPTEDTLAEEFVKYVDFTTTRHLSPEALCHSLGIEFLRTNLPETLRGHNCRYGGKSRIFVTQKESFVGAAEHTVIHELRELLEYEFKAAGWPTTNPDAMEELAEDFAVAVRVRRIQNEVPSWFDNVATIERKWPRRFAYVGLVVLTYLLLMGVTLLPYLEDLAEKTKES